MRDGLNRQSLRVPHSAKGYSLLVRSESSDISCRHGIRLRNNQRPFIEGAFIAEIHRGKLICILRITDEVPDAHPGSSQNSIVVQVDMPEGAN